MSLPHTATKRALRHAPIAVSLVVALACLILPVFGSLFGERSAPLDMASALRMQFVFVAFGALGLAAITRNRWIIGLAALALAWNAAAVLPWYFGRPARSSGSAFEVLSFNVLHQNTRFKNVVEFVLREQPLVAVFQEVTDPWPEELAPLRAEFSHHFRADVLQMEIFSRAPIVEPEITIVGKMRGFVRFRVYHEGYDIVMFATHTYPPLALGTEGFRWRNEQLLVIMPREINRFADVPVVVLGDLNATMWAPPYRKLIRQTGLQNARQGFGICPTLGSERLWLAPLALPYDHCLVNASLSVIDFRSGPFLGSDHLPFIARLAVQERR